MVKASEIIAIMEQSANPAVAAHALRFFKTGKGEYGEGDRFYGLTTPFLRSLVKKYYKEITFSELKILICHPWHEGRSFAVAALAGKFAKASEEQRREIVDFYLSHMDYVNNWDLVDISVHKILGIYCYSHDDYSILHKLAGSGRLWSERASVVANLYIVKQGNYKLIKELVVKFINHSHDLMHKACGWLLRELGKQDEGELCRFLDVYASKLPRTALRYSLERLSPEKKKYYMQKKD